MSALGWKQPLGAFRTNGGYGPFVKLCKVRFLRVAVTRTSGDNLHSGLIWLNPPQAASKTAYDRLLPVIWIDP